MHINTEELEKLSFADMLMTAATLSAKEEQEQLTREEAYLVAVLEQEYKRRVAKLTAPTGPFAFIEFLRKNGWERFGAVNGKCLYYEKGYHNNTWLEMEISNSLRCAIKDGEVLFNSCDIPTTAQEAETLFKLFGL